MATPKRSFKRPFQPCKNSHFGHPTPNRPSAPGAQKSTPSFILPNTIQSSLLDVGMRIRKSVPEGYQTQRKSSCGLPNAYNNITPERDGVTPSRGFTRLVPYCGILKIGGHDTQPSPPSEEDLPPLQFDCNDWGLLSSQESKASSDSLRPIVTVPMVSSHKRRHEDEDDELGLELRPVSPRSYPPFSHTRMPNLDQLRPIAFPKTRKKPVLEPLELRESEMIDVVDFEEADFLRPGEWGKGWNHADET